MDYYNKFLTKKTLYNIPYRKLSLDCKQHSKLRKEHVLIKRFFKKVLPYLYAAASRGSP